MDKNFLEIYERESNENTALILMLGVLSEKLTNVADLLLTSNKLSKEIISRLDGTINGSKKETTKIITDKNELDREDYME